MAAAIGATAASLVPDGARLQTGIGRIPSAVLHALQSRHDLGVHTEMLSDGLMDLAEAGVITGAKKTPRAGRMVTSFVMGTRNLYNWVDQNPQVELQPSDFINDPFIIAKNARMIAINSASVDLTGQVAADTVGGKFFSGIGGQVDFIRGASRSPGGKAPHRATIDGGQRRQESYSHRSRSGRRRRYQSGRPTLRGYGVRCRPAVGQECASSGRCPDRNCPSRCALGSLERSEASALRATDQPLANPLPPAPDYVERLARADMDPRCRACELGITIAEGWQGKRIGSLLEQLIRFARRRGFRSLFAHVLSSNLRRQRLLRRRGFSCSGDPGGPLTFRLPLGQDNA